MQLTVGFRLSGEHWPRAAGGKNKEISIFNILLNLGKKVLFQDSSTLERNGKSCIFSSVEEACKFLMPVAHFVHMPICKSVGKPYCPVYEFSQQLDSFLLLPG